MEDPIPSSDLSNPQQPVLGCIDGSVVRCRVWFDASVSHQSQQASTIFSSKAMVAMGKAGWKKKRLTERNWQEYVLEPEFHFSGALIFFLRKHFRVDEASMLKTGSFHHRFQMPAIGAVIRTATKVSANVGILKHQNKNKCHIQDLRDLLLQWHLGRLGRHRAPCKEGQTEWDINWLYHAAATADEELSHGHV